MFRGAGREKRRGEQFEVVLAFRLYIGSFPYAQLPGPVHIARWAECVFVYLAYVSALYVYLCFLICLYVPILLCFPEQLSHLPYSFWR